jgi:hypothetical protein
MKRRTWQRIITSIDLRFFHGCEFHSGTAFNISEKGIFISTSRYPTPNSTLSILFHTESGLLVCSARVIWVRKTNNSYNDMGVEILNPQKDYWSYIEDLKYTDKAWNH